jgi:hypothetical protein
MTRLVKSAVRTHVHAYFMSKEFRAGSADVRVLGVVADVTETVPTPGWPDRFTSKGTATLTLSGRSGTSQQKRSFVAGTEVKNGRAEVVSLATL